MCYCSFDISSQATSLQREKYDGLDHAVDRSVHSVQNRFNCTPLLYHDHLRVFEFRSVRTTILSRKKIASSFEDTQPLKICTPEFLRARDLHQAPPRVLA